MAVWTKTWGRWGRQLWLATSVGSVGYIVMHSNIFGILQAAIPHMSLIWYGTDHYIPVPGSNNVTLSILHVVTLCSGRTSAYEATHTANWYFNTKFKLDLLRWSFCVTSLCNLKCKCRVLCVCDNILAALCTSIVINKSDFVLPYT
jgi:hypothetical protein